MAVKIRFAHRGKKHAPVYRIIAIDEREKRDGRALENLGTYDPINHKVVQFHKERIDAWVANGAVMSDAIKKLYKQQIKVAPVGKA